MAGLVVSSKRSPLEEGTAYPLLLPDSTTRPTLQRLRVITPADEISCSAVNFTPPEMVTTIPNGNSGLTLPTVVINSSSLTFRISLFIYPSCLEDIPSDVTFITWTVDNAHNRWVRIIQKESLSVMKCGCLSTM